ncbi:uncharacterized protein LOC110186287 [Drosophila serrata]|uniref:uncharacterized protein LOC110186287 n=1 Tax=Drosophila serrata TaxID=7274 RepID=UPI000A1D17F3|nr:uncharacterized protein LOC110186287 [Drosophila serrata]
MFLRSSRFIQLIVCLNLINNIISKVEFTNIKCNSLDTDFANFEYCFLKSVNRHYKYLSLKVNIELQKRYSVYRTFLYNVTVDACRFLKNPQSNPIGIYLYGFFRDYSNMNHTCPFNHDLIVDKLPVNFTNRHVTEVLPFPTGDYLFRSNWIAYDINRARVDVYFTLS